MSLDDYKFRNQTPYNATPYGLGEDGVRDAAKEDEMDVEAVTLKFDEPKIVYHCDLHICIGESYQYCLQRVDDDAVLGTCPNADKTSMHIKFVWQYPVKQLRIETPSPWPLQKKQDRAPIPPGSYSDLSLMPHDGPQCCDSVRRMTCVCASAWNCPEHGEWHFGTHD